MPKKLTIEEMQKIAESRGGKCLSNEYVDNKAKLKWQCKEGHVWDNTPAHVKGGQWCPICAVKVSSLKRSLTIEEMQTIAESRGGKCLSTKYININTKLKWQCAEGHVWEAVPGSIKAGTWCPTCGGSEKLTIEEMQEIARQRGGNCLSTEYVNAHTKLKWQCAEGHNWEAVPGSIKSGTWCPTCAGLEKLTIEAMQKLAKQRGGNCLSTEYINARTNLKWQCEEGHTWDATPDNIKRGQWCPRCATGISERICRKLFETIFNENFPKSRPKWLINDRGNQMELDGYNKKLALAFEYQGEQHYDYVVHFHESIDDFKQRKADDQLKRELCEVNDVILIEIPYTIEYDQFQNYIINKCKEKNVNIPKINEKINYKELGIYSSHNLEEMHKIAENKGGKCLSTSFINTKTKLRWQCKEGHIWEAVPSHVKEGHWCPTCGGSEKLTIEAMQKLARQRGGTCLSTEYVNALTKLKWQCAAGHVWEAVPSSIRKGHWCQKCARIEIGLKRRSTIEEMQEIARQRDGKCLSTDYINAKIKLTWQCKEGHIWDATPDNIKRGKWCRKCAGMEKSTIEEMQEIARQRGGKCLSIEYVNAHTKLRWQCAEEHNWEATPTNIKSKKWCPKCARKGKKRIQKSKQLEEFIN